METKNKRRPLTQKQRTFLKAYEARLCNVSKAATLAKVTRQTVYKWLTASDTFKNAKHDVEEAFYDQIETTMFTKATIDKDTTMLIWLSKTKMKNRGYVEKLEQEVSINPFEQLMKAATSEDGDK